MKNLRNAVDETLRPVRQPSSHLVEYWVQGHSDAQTKTNASDLIATQLKLLIGQKELT